jgi:hypothetical protein
MSNAQVYRGITERTGVIILNSCSNSGDLKLRVFSYFSMQVSENGSRCALKSFPLPAHPEFEIKTWRCAGYSGVILKVVVSEITEMSKLLRTGHLGY